jgi:hypothetical protein
MAVVDGVALDLSIADLSIVDLSVVDLFIVVGAVCVVGDVVVVCATAAVAKNADPISASAICFEIISAPPSVPKISEENT